MEPALTRQPIERRATPGATTERGAVLVELVVSTVLLLLLISIATQLLSATQRRFARAGRAMENTSLDLVVARLRHDVRDAGAVLARTSASWSHDGLVLRTLAGERVRWRLDDEDLVRDVLSTLGTTLPDRRQVLLKDVVTFRWRRPPSTLRAVLEIEVVDRGQVERLGTAAPATGVAASTLRRRALRVALRGVGGRSW